MGSRVGAYVATTLLAMLGVDNMVGSGNNVQLHA